MAFKQLIVFGRKAIGWIASATAFLFEFARKIGIGLGLLLGCVITTGSLVGGAILVAKAGTLSVWRFLLPFKSIGVSVSGLGCFLGGWLVANYSAKVIKLASNEATKREEAKRDARRMMEEVDRKSVELSRIRIELDKAKSELDERRGRRIDVNAIRSIFKLGLAEADMSITDFHGEWLDDFSDSWYSPSTTASRYVGVLRKTFVATFGADMNNVVVRETTDSLLIGGLVTETIGIRRNRNEWLLEQTQKYHLRKTTVDKADELPAWKVANRTVKGGNEFCYVIDEKELAFDGTFDQNRIAAKKSDQEQRLNDNIEAGFGFQGVNDYILDMAENFLRHLLAPTGKTIEFVQTVVGNVEPSGDWMKLIDFVTDYNKRLDSPSRV